MVGVQQFENMDAVTEFLRSRGVDEQVISVILNENVGGVSL